MEQEQEVSTETLEQESSSLETPPITSPTGTPIKSEKDDDKGKRVMAALEATLREQNRIIAEQNEKLAQATTAPPPTRDLEEERQRFYQDPSSVIRDEIEKSVGPIRDFIREFKAGDKKGDLIREAKKDYRFTKLFEKPGFESAVVDMVNQLSAENLNLPNVLSAVVQVSGLAAAGLLEGVNIYDSTPTPTPTPTPTREETNTVTIPPHVRPSGSAPAQPPAGKKLRALNENEKRLAREKGLSDEQYLSWLEVPAQEVASSDIGREGKK